MGKSSTTVYGGPDVHKDSIVIALAEAGGDPPNPFLRLQPQLE